MCVDVFSCMYVFLFVYNALYLCMEKEMATHVSIAAWRIPIHRGAWKAAVHGVAKSQA